MTQVKPVEVRMLIYPTCPVCKRKLESEKDYTGEEVKVYPCDKCYVRVR